MARGAHETLGDRILGGLVITKRGSSEPLPWPVLEAGHPMPDEASLKAGERLIEFVKSIPQDAQVLVLLSGGASALVEALPSGLGLAQLRELNRWLLGAGLDIHAMNAIRKRISLLKGGRLAQLLYPRKVLCLAISDVSGDDPRSIGSGPLVAEPEVDTPQLSAGAPEWLRTALQQTPSLPRPSDACFRSVEFQIIARLDDAKRAAAETAKKLGYKVKAHAEFIEGDAVETGERLARELLESKPGVVQVWGGETTVRLPSTPGRGDAIRAWRFQRRWYWRAARTCGCFPPAPTAATGRPRTPARWWMAKPLRAVRYTDSTRVRRWRKPTPGRFSKPAAI